MVILLSPDPFITFAEPIFLSTFSLTFFSIFSAKAPDLILLFDAFYLSFKFVLLTIGVDDSVTLNLNKTAPILLPSYPIISKECDPDPFRLATINFPVPIY